MPIDLLLSRGALLFILVLLPLLGARLLLLTLVLLPLLGARLLLLALVLLPLLGARLLLLILVLLPLLGARLLLLILVLLALLSARLLLLILVLLPLLSARLLLLILVLLLLCIDRSSDPEKQEQNTCADKSDSFHLSPPPIIRTGQTRLACPVLRHRALPIGHVSRGLLVESGKEQFRRGGRANCTIDYDVLRGGSFSVEPLVAIIVSAES